MDDVNETVPGWLLAQIEEAERNVAWLENRRGATDSYWHRELKRRRAAAEAYEAVADDETDMGQEE